MCLGEPALVPAGVAGRTEEDGALVVVDPVDLKPGLVKNAAQTSEPISPDEPVTRQRFMPPENRAAALLSRLFSRCGGCGDGGGNPGRRWVRPKTGGAGGGDSGCRTHTTVSLAWIARAPENEKSRQREPANPPPWPLKPNGEPLTDSNRIPVSRVVAGPLKGSDPSCSLTPKRL